MRILFSRAISYTGDANFYSFYAEYLEGIGDYSGAINQLKKGLELIGANPAWESRIKFLESKLNK